MSGISVATIKSPEFINIAPTDVNPLISKCEVKVLYVGENRNRSYITKEVAAEMAKTLPGTPIVGYYSENKEDFGDHGDQMIIDGDGIRFNCLTKPYGFVPIGTQPWFQEFEDTDEFGNKVTREYLMCEGYLWTEQYKEAQKVINEGRPHSMELDEKTLKGHWSTDNNRGIEFFIINDAIFSKLCILGEDVEPCFEGSSVTAPEVSSTFAFKGNEFTATLFTMMEELKELTYSLQNKGGNSMTNLDNAQVSDEFVVLDEDTTVVAPVVEETASNEETTITTTEEIAEENQETLDKEDLETSIENQNITEEFSKKSDKDEDKSEDEKDSESNDSEKEEDDEEDKKPAKNTLDGADKYAILEQQIQELTTKCSALEKENADLLAFKNAAEDKEKDELIKSFYMLSDEDKQDVVENKSKYTLDEIESKLSVICVRKKVSFDNNNSDAELEAATTYNLHSSEVNELPAWLQAVEDLQNRN